MTSPAEYLALGYSLFPCSAEKAPTTPRSTPDRPGGGHHWAVATLAEYEELQRRFPGPNHGMKIPDGVVVIDVDVDSRKGIDGRSALREIHPDFEPDFWPGPIQRTPRGGWHLVARAPERLTGNSSGSLPRGIDVRACGKGYICVEPSATADGAYRWQHPLVPVTDLPDVPPWLADLIITPKRCTVTVPPVARSAGSGPCREATCERWHRRARNYSARALARLDDTMATASHRHETLLDCCLSIGALVAGGLCGQTEAEAALRQAAGCASRPMPELDRCIRDGFRRAADAPKRLSPCERCVYAAKERTTMQNPKPRDESYGDKTPQVPIEQRPEIDVKGELHEIADQAITALSTDRKIWQRQNVLVTILPAEIECDDGKWSIPIGTPSIRELATATIRERMSASATWLKYDARAKEYTPSHPPKDIAEIVRARGVWRGIPALRALSEYPVIRPDGSVLGRPGYDPITRYYVLESCPQLDIPSAPTREECQRAAGLLYELVNDFPFADKISRAAWLAGLLTPLARPAISGSTPIFITTANVKRCGKGLLVNTAGNILLGREMVSLCWPNGDQNGAEETEKRLVAIALAGYPIICWDNVSGSLGHDKLDSFLTSSNPSGRVLCQSKVPTFPDWSTVMYATGNNCGIAADTGNRAIFTRLESPDEFPEARTGFAQPDLLSHVRAERGLYLTAALTILVGHAYAGRPSSNGRAKGSFESWCHVVRDALLWLGLPDVERTPDDPHRLVDDDHDLLEKLISSIAQLAGVKGISTSGLLEYLEPNMPCPDELREAIAELDHRPKPSLKRVAKGIRLFIGRWKNDRCIRELRDVHRKAPTWIVEVRHG
jgi:putative DNA primase/helicase